MSVYHCDGFGMCPPFGWHRHSGVAQSAQHYGLTLTINRRHLVTALESIYWSNTPICLAVCDDFGNLVIVEGLR